MVNFSLYLIRMGMDAVSKPVEHYRQSDVTFWGIMAIAASGLAVSATALPALLPPQIFTALHASRYSGADVNSLRAEISTLLDETAVLKLDNAQMITRMGLAEKNRGIIQQRVGALENTLPLLVEQIPPGQAVDTSIVTSSVDNGTKSTDIPGGSVEISHTPLYPDEPADPSSGDGATTPSTNETVAPSADAAPKASDPGLEPVETDAYGLAMGGTVSLSDAYVSWLDLRNKIGALLIGMEPILSGQDGGYHIVAGPVDRIARAEELCGYIEKAGLQCLPVPYSGYKMPM